jgi:ATP-dependent DNA ligase
VRFPRILKFREDKRIEDADSIETIHQMLDSLGASRK